MFILLFQAANRNLLLGFIPESLGLLLFGIGLIVFAVSLRRILNRKDETKDEGFVANIHKTISDI